MIIPEQLWIPSAKDAVSMFAPVRRFVLVDTTVAAAAIVVDAFTVPGDYIAVVTQVSAVWVSGGAQVLTDLRATVRDERNTANLVDFMHVRTTVALGLVEGAVERQCQIVMMPQEILRVAASFSGAVANRVQFFAHGVLIPRGNWQR